MAGGNYKFIFLTEDYFKGNIHFEEMLDPCDIEKQTRRNYAFLNINYEGNDFFVPLRTEIEAEKPFGIIGYSVPSTTRPNAGLDFRKMLIVNDPKYIITPQYCNIPQSQQKIISDNYSKISNLINNYIKGYIKAAKKGREKRDPKYCFSTLHNFHEELGIVSAINNINEDTQQEIVDKPKTIEDISSKSIDESVKEYVAQDKV